MKTTLELPDALVSEVEMRAQREGCKLDDAVAELLRKGLATCRQGAVSSKRPIFTHPQSGLPYIDCLLDAPARSMTLRDVMAVEHETLDREDAERAGLSS